MTLLDHIKILVVEDDPVQAEILKDKLNEMVMPASIICFDQSEDLLNHLKEGISPNKYHYLILDYFLQTQKHPDSLNGLELIKIITQQYPTIKIILFSAFESDENTNFIKLKEEYKLLDFVKKNTHGYPSLINIIRFNFSLLNLEKRRKRLKLAVYALIGLTAFLLVQIIYYFA